MKTAIEKHRLTKWVITAVILAVLFSFASGCTKQTRYEVLTFFFTGVPPLEEQREVGGEEKKTAAEKEELDAGAPKAENKIAPKPTLYSHKPYAERRCDLCHQTTAFFGRFRQTKSARKIKLKGQVPGLLVAPPNELCVTCHKSVSVSNASKEGLRLHGPAAQGKCSTCHAPHQSTTPYLLIVKRTEICTQCHSEGYMFDTADHRKAEDCLSCHNPHLGKKKNLLKKVFKEVIQPVNLSPTVSRPQASSGNLQTGENATRTVAKPVELRSQAKSSSSVKPARTMPSLQEVMRTQKGSVDKVGDQGESDVAPEEAHLSTEAAAKTDPSPGGL